MAKRGKGDKRIEPGFDGPRKTSAPDIRLDASDRVLPPGAERRQKSETAKARPHGANRNPSPVNGRQGQRGRQTTSRRRTKPARRFSLVRRLVYWGLVLGVWGGIGLACLFGYYAAQLPQMSSWNVPERPPNARIVSVDGELVANRGATGGEAMQLDEMSPYLPLAVIAIEDRRFKSHFGLDPLGLARAVVTNLVTGRLVQGGSTLTQQLAKNLFLEPERTLERKVQEAVLAVWLETKFSKDQILELYLNRVYFGAGAYGVDAASRRYFGKSARDLNLAEAATIAGLLKAPSRLSPARDPKAAEERAQVVLGAMRREGFITDREAAQAMSMQPGRAKRYWSGSQHYVADMIMQQLPALIGTPKKDVVVDTTVDLDLQRSAETVLRDMLDEEGGKRNVSQAALVALDGTGAIRALIGGREYSKSQFNRATDAKRQPGSAFKPIVYLAALEAGRSPDSVRQDAPVKIGNWTPENYDRKYRGPVTLSDGLSQSLNTIAAQLVMEVGPKTVVETAHRLGIRSELQRNASIALGTSEVSLLELVSAYAPFSNGGYGVTPFLIRRVTTVDGEVLYERQSPLDPQVVRPRELGMMNSMLTRVVNSGTGKAARIPGWQTAGKTGTTQNSRDALFVGYTANLVAGIWFGNDDGTPMNKVTGGSLPAQAWGRFMTAAHKGVPVADLPGAYVPETAALPLQRPAQGNQGTANGELAPVPIAENGGGPRPNGELGGQKPRPRGILDLLFGTRKNPG